MAGRDEAEFEAYVVLDGGRLLGFALLLAGDYQDAEDLVQVALSARTGRPLRRLLTEHAAYSADPVDPGWYIGSCLLAAADRTGSHLLVSCDRFGRLDRGRFTALPGAAPATAVAAAW